jgi:hypothetical protein
LRRFRLTAAATWTARSATSASADLAEGLRIVLTPALGQPDEIGKRFAALLEAEVKTLRDGGPNVGLIAPGAAGIKAFGPSLTDATHRFAAAFAGPCRGLNNADKIRGAWSD